MNNNNLFLDLETTGLDTNKDRIVVGGFKLNDAPTYVQYPPFDGTETAGLLQSRSTTIVGHNVLFDIAFLENAGYVVQGPILDTKMLAHAILPNRKLKLKSLGKDLLNLNVVELKTLIGKNGDIESIDKNILEAYVKQDVDIVYSLFNLFKDSIPDWVYNVEIPLTSLIKEIQKRGVFTDTEKILELDRIWKEKLKEISAKYTFNINSPKQVSGFIKSRGVVSKSTDKIHLIDIQKRVPEVKDILEYRELAKLTGTYTSKFVEVNDRGMIRGVFNQCGTITGRMSSSNPNLQNIPARSQNGKALRRSFVAPSGFSMVVGDISQIEPRFVAFYTHSKSLNRIYSEGLDFHTTIARLAYSKDNISKDERFVGKTIGLATMYGARPLRLMKELRKYGLFMDLQAVSNLHSNIEKYFDDVITWKNKYEERAEYVGGIRTYGGRFIRLGGVRPLDIFNTLIQGSCADLIKLITVNLEEEGLKIVNIIHDEILVYAPKEIAAQDRDRIQKIMESTISLYPMNICCDVSIVDTWADK